MDMNLFLISSLLLTITTIVVVILAYFGRKILLARLLTIFTSTIFLWGIGGLFFSQAKSYHEALFWINISAIGVITTPVIFLHVVYTLCNIKTFKFLIFAYVVTLFFNLTDVFGFLNRELRLVQLLHGYIYYPAPVNLLWPLIFICWVVLTVFGSYILLIHYYKAIGIKRNQILYFLLATSIGFMGGIINFLPIFTAKVYPYSNFLVSVYCIIVTYAILRYRLMDIKVAITRAGIFIAVYTLVLGFPFAVAGVFKNFLVDYFGPGWWMFPLVLMAVLATVGPFIYIFLQHKAEDRLLKEQRRYQETLKHASVGMTRIRNLRKLLDLIAHIVTKTVRISYAAIYLYDRHANECVLQVSRDKGRVTIPKIAIDNPLITWLTLNREPLIHEEVKRMAEDAGDDAYRALEESMRILGASVVIPSFLDDKFMGLFVLGDKKSGQIYTPDDLNVFEVLASQAALAIENAQFYEEAKEMHEQIAQAEKMATIGTMADGLSHQINNRFYALSLIAGDSIDTIKTTDTSKCSPEIKEMIESINYALGRIQSNVIQGGEVVRGLLKYSRKGDEGLEALKLNDIIDNTLEMVQFKVKLSEIDLIRDFTSDLPKIKGNMTQLNEAFFNFIDNAYDAIVERRNTLKEPGYRGKITISAKPLDSHIQIIIQDNGMGIKDDDNRKVFTPFFTTKISARKGTGLGLYVIRRIIIESHRGKIAFQSEYKVGTRFTLELPVAI